jgi:hypothetical protein
MQCRDVLYSTLHRCVAEPDVERDDCPDRRRDQQDTEGVRPSEPEARALRRAHVVVPTGRLRRFVGLYASQHAAHTGR